MPAIFTLGTRVFAGVILLSAGLDKIRSRDAFIQVLTQEKLFGARGKTLSLTVPAMEMALGSSLLAGLYWRLAAVASGALMIAFAGMLFRGRSTPEGCGCGGVVRFPESRLKQAAFDATLSITLLLTAFQESTYLALPNWGSPFQQRIESLTPTAVAALLVLLALLGGLTIRRFIRTHWPTIVAIAREHQSQRDTR